MLPIVELADLLLLIMLRGSYPTLMISAQAEGHHVSVGDKEAVAVLPLPLGDALVARLCAIAGLDFLLGAGQFGHFRASFGGHEEALAVAVRISPHGLCAELLRLAETKAEAPGADYNSYELLRELGRGNIGAVFLAKHKPLGRLVAIKVLHDANARDTSDAERFIREARAAGRVRHPCVVEIFDFGYTPNNQPFLVMELIDGKTLRAQLTEPMQPARALEIARQITSALHAVHSAGVVHRDLKPDNIFVGVNDWVKIVDFGAAKDLAESDLPNITQEGIILGTPIYMSPEHVQGKKVDHRTDLYALGCVLFEMLTGKPPFVSKTALEVFMAHCTAPIPEVTSPGGPLPSIIQTIIDKALAKDPDDRYQSANAMLIDLERAKFAVSRKGWRRWLPL